MPPDELRRDGADRVRGADDDRACERRRPCGAAHDELERSRRRREGEVDGLGLKQDALRVAETAGVGDGEAQLEMRRVLVVGRDERAAGDADEVLQRVRVAVRRAVVEDQRPAERGRGERPLLRVGRGAGEGDRCRRPARSSRRSAPTIVATGGELPAVIVTAVRVGGAGRVGHAQLDVVGARLRVGERRRRRRRVVERAVAVEVPGVGERVGRSGSRRAGAVEGDGQRGGARRRRRRRHGRSAARSRSRTLIRRTVPPSRST